MSGPDSGDSDDDGAGTDDSGRREESPSDGTTTPDETHADETSTQPTGGSTQKDDGASTRSDRDTEVVRGTDANADTGADADANSTAGTGTNANGSSSTDTRATATGPDGDSPDRNDVTIEDDGVIRWFLKTDDGTVIFARDVLSSVAIVAVVGLLLFGVSGIWPPLVAVESGSMEPNMERGDLIFVVDDDRFVGDAPAGETGVVTLENGQTSDHEKFGKAGDVIVFKPGGSDRQTPVIHRAHFWVEEGENWVDTKANEEYIGDASCTEVRTCPATKDGFITKGDANSGYDQHQGGARTGIVEPEWVTGKAMFRIPYLGHVRLTFDAIFGGMIAPSPSVVSAGPAGGGTAWMGLEAVGAAGATATGVTAAVAVRRRRF